ncbi:uncharacterized protein LOC141637984 [Silene latifolia]|uniref:uncharacterized protein LOC141637984 n=1 Tax=Silene latifolia TaxID=37657 RepID=UPI003D7713FC
MGHSAEYTLTRPSTDQRSNVSAVLVKMIREMSAAVSSSPANQDRPLLLPSPLPSDQRTSGRRMWTLLDLLTVEKLDAQDPRSIIRSDDGEPREVSSRWRILRERLGCCGVATWRYGNDDDDDNQIDIIEEINEETDVSTRHRSSGINLAAALAAEREYRTATEEISSDGVGEGGGGNTTPSRVSLMRLLEETADGGELERESKGGGGERVEEEVVEVEVEGSDSVCCVCMGRNKGAAFIPCGHTYCRVCSRELWLSRGSCPLCNQRILDILDIF